MSIPQSDSSPAAPDKRQAVLVLVRRLAARPGRLRVLVLPGERLGHLFHPSRTPGGAFALGPLLGGGVVARFQHSGFDGRGSDGRGSDGRGTAGGAPEERSGSELVPFAGLPPLAGEWTEAKRTQLLGAISRPLTAAERATALGAARTAAERDRAEDWVVEPSFVLALSQAYRFPGDLGDFPGSDRVRQVAVLSHFVFDVDEESVELPEAATGGGAPVLLGGHPVRWEVEALEPPAPIQLFEVEVEQRPGGVRVRLRDPRRPDASPFAAPAGSRLSGGRVLRVRRAVGTVPPAELPMHTVVLESVGNVTEPGVAADADAAPSWHFVDPLGADELVGQQLHYRFELVDVHERVVGIGSATVLRERLEPPPRPAEVRAVFRNLPDQPRRLRVEIVPILAKGEDASLLQLELLRDERPLDDVGWYGDDDDLALLEGLAEADRGGEPGVEGLAELGEDALVRLRGAYEREGLQVVCAAPLGELQIEDNPHGGTPVRVLELEGEAVDAWLRGGVGHRLLVGLTRRTSQGPKRSRLRVARHLLELPDAAPVPVFQLERFDFVARPRRFVSRRELAVEAVDRGDELPCHLDLRFVHHRLPAYPGEGAPAALPVGGYRAWYRDIIGTGQGGEGLAAEEPAGRLAARLVRDPVFRHAEDFQVLPPLVAAHRTVSFGSTHPWRVAERSRLGVGAAVDARLLPRGRAPTAWEVARARVRQAATALTSGPGARFRPLVDLDESPQQGGPSSKMIEHLAAAPAGDSWASFGRLVATFEQLGLAVDLVLRGGGSSSDPAQVLAAAAAAGPTLPARVLVLAPLTADGHPMARIRLVAVPAGTAAPGAPTGLEALLPAASTDLGARLRRFLDLDGDEGPQLVVLVDAQRRPATLTLGPMGQVAWTWTGQSDAWHHDQEWVVEVLDRYARIRALVTGDPGLASGGRATLAPHEVAEDGRVPVTVPRTMPVQDLVPITPAATWRRVSIAFRLSDTVERLAATHSAAVRARLGRVRQHVEIRRELPHRERWTEPAVIGGYGAVPAWWSLPAEELPETAPPASRWQDLHTVSAQPGDLGEEWVSAGGRNPWRGPHAVPGPVKPQGGEVELVPLPDTDLVSLDDSAYFYRYHLAAWLTADDRVGPRAEAHQDRRPGCLGLVRPPEATVQWQGSVASFELRWVAPALASHLSPAELAEANRGADLLLHDLFDVHGIKAALVDTALATANATEAASDLAAAQAVASAAQAVASAATAVASAAQAVASAARAATTHGELRAAMDRLVVEAGAEVRRRASEEAEARRLLQEAEDALQAEAAELDRLEGETEARGRELGQTRTELARTGQALADLRASDRRVARAASVLSARGSLVVGYRATADSFTGFRRAATSIRETAAVSRSRAERDALRTARAELLALLGLGSDRLPGRADADVAALAALADQLDTDLEAAGDPKDAGRYEAARQKTDQAVAAAQALLAKSVEERDALVDTTDMSAASAAEQHTLAAEIARLEKQEQEQQAAHQAALAAEQAQRGRVAAARALRDQREADHDRAEVAVRQAASVLDATRERAAPLRRAADNFELPVPALPDVELVTTFALNIGKGKPERLVPLARIWGPSAPGVPDKEAIEAHPERLERGPMGAVFERLSPSVGLGAPALRMDGPWLVARWTLEVASDLVRSRVEDLVGGDPAGRHLRIGLQRGDLTTPWGLVPAGSTP